MNQERIRNILGIRGDVAESMALSKPSSHITTSWVPGDALKLQSLLLPSPPEVSTIREARHAAGSTGAHLGTSCSVLKANAFQGKPVLKGKFAKFALKYPGG
jgi:hypothetical protein